MGHQHCVQFFGADEPTLNRNIGRFFWDALLRGEGLVIIASSSRCQAAADHLTRLGADMPVLVKERQILVLDAEQLLNEFMVDGLPDPLRFETVVSGVLASVQSRSPDAGICAYGEMVALLWERGNREGAIRLEECWNHLLRSKRVSLFCGYPIDVFGEDFATRDVAEILRAHTHTMPTGPDGILTDALRQAARDVLGAEEPHESLALSGEAAILWLREQRPASAGAILTRARQYFVAARPFADAASAAD